MSDPGNVMVTDHLRNLTGCKIDALLAGATAIRGAIARWYRGEELAQDDASMRIVNNSGDQVVTVARQKPATGPQPARPATGPQPGKPATGPQSVRPPTGPQPEPETRASAVDVLRGVEETQRRSVAALKAMVELLIEKGVFSREEYLARVKR
jgi:hypothetical protein